MYLQERYRAIRPKTLEEITTDAYKSARHGHVGPVAPPQLFAPIYSYRPRRTFNTLALWEIVLFATVCTADMLSTLYWYLHGMALEANPLLRPWLERSVTAFCIAKLLSFVPLLVVCAVFRERHPRLIVGGLRIALAAYVVIYIIAVASQFTQR